ncbi:MAG: lipocalin family protein [Niabella sp.]|nr:lipocalin family protein [Niabella sp.]
MKKITCLFLLAVCAISLLNCSKNKKEILQPGQLTGLWSQTSFNYKAYKAATIIEEYTNQTETGKQITIHFFNDGRFETYERSLQDGVWEVTEHVEGTYTYDADAGVLVMDDKAGGAHATATVLTLSDQQLTFFQAAAPPLDNAEADKEVFTFYFNRVP